MEAIALTGGICSGKTTLSDIAQKEFGFQIIDADEINRSLLQLEDVLLVLSNIISKSLLGLESSEVRQQLRAAMTNSELKQRIESYLHPLIFESINLQLQSRASRCIVVIPLMVEKNRCVDYAHRWTVELEESLQIRRIIERYRCSHDHAKTILSWQASSQARQAWSSKVIWNNHLIDDFKETCRYELRAFNQT